jgi:hypothetical protein
MLVTEIQFIFSTITSVATTVYVSNTHAMWFYYPEYSLKMFYVRTSWILLYLMLYAKINNCGRNEDILTIK